MSRDAIHTGAATVGARAQPAAHRAAIQRTRTHGAGLTAADIASWPGVGGHGPWSRIDPRAAVYAITIFVFSALDAALTLTMIGAGFAHEVNPFMRQLIETDPQVFVNVKLLATGLAVAFMVAFSKRVVFGRFQVERIMSWLVCIYSMLICYEICMLFLGFFG
jgi:hypothetical protein